MEPNQRSTIEPVQVVRYGQNESYMTHTDYFPPSFTTDTNWLPNEGGTNRFATILMYLNDVEEGGHTAFPFGVFGDAANRVDDEQESAFAERLSSGDSTTLAPYCASLETSVAPRKGGAILFYSQRPGGELDTRSIHAGCPVAKGVKWASNVWIWNRDIPQELRRGG
jgi:prolyl 4-hydroxylase